ncbi:MAG TPA: mannose-1-phosphate guanylyltransferase [Syntrophobacter fumaroxidans]|nr:mannose-1-phosphate guanylyltransferase [Syntrophobacter fumaroxidans]
MYIVIMAGGSGTRFWPVSRKARPKQLLSIIGDQPMVKATYERIKGLVPDSRIILVVGREHFDETSRLFSGTEVRILAEPQGKNTAPCIGLAARYVEYLAGNAPMVILPADHFVARPDVFRTALLHAVSLSANDRAIVTLGIVPTRPETGYGYIETDPVERNVDGVAFHRVKRFVEKPPLHKAEEYLLGGGTYWNAGIFVAASFLLLAEFSEHMPAFHSGLTGLTGFDSDEHAQRLASLYEGIDGISFDYAIMEKTGRTVYVLPCDCGWSDVGSWYSLYETRRAEQDEAGNLAEGDAMLIDCRGSFVMARGNRHVAALGVNGILIVDTEDAVLVADLEKAQEVRKVISDLKGRCLNKLL